MNNDLISREALLENAQRMTEYDEAGWGVPVRVVKAEYIEKAPAVDAVEVVRCKECKHWEGFAPGSDKGACIENDCIMYGDDFCSYGVREE